MGSGEHRTQAITVIGDSDGETATVHFELRSQVTERVHRCGSRRVNWYFLEGDGDVIVVDAGGPIQYELLVSSLDTVDYTCRTSLLAY